MPTINIQLTGVSVELALGHYLPTDTTIFKNWEDFYHYNDLVHVSQLLTDYISGIEIRVGEQVVFSGKIPQAHIKPQKSFSPVMENRALYLRTECAEEAVYQCSLEADDFDKKNLFFETQDYDALFKTGSSFLSKVVYGGREHDLQWVSGKPVGNICVLCRYEGGYLVPVYDAIKKVEANKE